jgi:hypothetical protein
MRYKCDDRMRSTSRNYDDRKRNERVRKQQNERVRKQNEGVKKKKREDVRKKNGSVDK